MEGQITFDLWGEPAASRRTQALDFLSTNAPHLSRIDMLREYVAAISTHVPMLIAEDLDWQSLLILKARAAMAFDKVATYQSGYPPGRAELRECSIHLLYYGGVLGCPVCDNTHLEAPKEGAPRRRGSP